ncbi:uncharacterized protein LOC135398114 isoform X1 [Ornithodoros turicata]|uniref:uncharacterized protein LOC135398114 isoform X1 n=1 Tax=Ornithodoros turicata TaxID=34597 RepID=UPI0031396F72
MAGYSRAPAPAAYPAAYPAVRPAAYPAAYPATRPPTAPASPVHTVAATTVGATTAAGTPEDEQDEHGGEHTEPKEDLRGPADFFAGLTPNERNIRIFYCVSFFTISVVVALGVFIIIIGPDRPDFFTNRFTGLARKITVEVTDEQGSTSTAARPITTTSSDDSSGCFETSSLTLCVIAMGKSYTCIPSGSSKNRHCLEWDAQYHCLKSPRFANKSHCEDTCAREGGENCTAVTTCSCSGDYRRTNWVYDTTLGCRLLNQNYCVESKAGFRDAKTCTETCTGSGTSPDDRCNGTYTLRSCTFEDRLYRYFWDTKLHECVAWEKKICLQDAYEELHSCHERCS